VVEGPVSFDFASPTGDVTIEKYLRARVLAGFSRDLLRSHRLLTNWFATMGDMKANPSQRRAALAVALTSTLVFAACGSNDSSSTESAGSTAAESVEATEVVTTEAEPVETVTTEAGPVDTESVDTAAPDTAVSVAEAPVDTEAVETEVAVGHLGSYSLANDEFGTMTTVTVDAGIRTIATNALPDHETGEFPTEGNPNTISAQDLTYEFAAEGTFVGNQGVARTPGVSVNGVKFEPGTAETVTCESGETLRVEALQDVYDLGLDFNNAHVQPTGEYHYHGISELLADAYSTDEDLVHVGFAADGFLIYYSKAGAYSSGYALSTDARLGTDCVGSMALGGVAVEIDGSAPDGTYTADWVFGTDNGELDECNGVEIDGEYAYMMTDEWPFIGRCLNGEFTEAGPGEAGEGPPPGGGGEG
jgi:hypothetical protein